MNIHFEVPATADTRTSMLPANRVPRELPAVGSLTGDSRLDAVLYRTTETHCEASPALLRQLAAVLGLIAPCLKTIPEPVYHRFGCFENFSLSWVNGLDSPVLCPIIFLVIRVDMVTLIKACGLDVSLTRIAVDDLPSVNLLRLLPEFDIPVI